VSSPPRGPPRSGGRASYPELCAIVRELGRYCGATAPSVSMHMHPAGTLVCVWRQGGPVAPLLGRIAREQLVLVTSGASDWLESGGTAERVDGGTGCQLPHPLGDGLGTHGITWPDLPHSADPSLVLGWVQSTIPRRPRPIPNRRLTPALPAPR